MNVKVLVALFLLVGIGFSAYYFMPAGVKAIAVGEKVRPVSLPDLSGAIQGLPEGKVMLVNFWATWCPPCRKEVPSMVKLYDTYKDKGLEIVAISVDRRLGDVLTFVKENEMRFTVLHDQDSKVSQKYGVFRYPETFIVDKQGIVRQHLNGAVEWTSSKFTAYIDALLAEPEVK